MEKLNLDFKNSIAENGNKSETESAISFSSHNLLQEDGLCKCKLNCLNCDVNICKLILLDFLETLSDPKITCPFCLNSQDLIYTGEVCY